VRPRSSLPGGRKMFLSSLAPSPLSETGGKGAGRRGIGAGRAEERRVSAGERHHVTASVTPARNTRNPHTRGCRWHGDHSDHANDEEAAKDLVHGLNAGALSPYTMPLKTKNELLLHPPRSLRLLCINPSSSPAAAQRPPRLLLAPPPPPPLDSSHSRRAARASARHRIKRQRIRFG